MKTYLVFYEVQSENGLSQKLDTIFVTNVPLTNSLVEKMRSRLTASATEQSGLACKVVFIAPWMLLEDEVGND